jgi:heme transport system ATP-binding protein
MFELQAVTIQRAGRTLIDAVDLAIKPGCLTAVLGPNGAGKSTLIKALSGEWRPSGGRVLLDGRDLRHVPPAHLARRRAIVPQSTMLSFPFTAIEVVMLGATVPGFGLDTDQGPALAALADVGLGEFASRNYVEMSGGERQRVHIARALCQLRSARSPARQATALLLDEPTSNLDPAHQTLVVELLHNEAKAGRTVVIVLHDLNLAAAWTDEIVLMARGRICARGKPADVFVDETLSTAYGCKIRANTLPEPGAVFVLPHHARFDANMTAMGEPSAAQGP